MCLITRQRKPKITTKDITVYKLLRSDNTAYFIVNFHYIPEKLYKTVLMESDEWCCYGDIDGEWLRENFGDWQEKKPKSLKCIGSGFHSFMSKKRCESLYSSGFLHTCTIPAGSEIYKDATGLIVSNQIIVHAL